MPQATPTTFRRLSWVLVFAVAASVLSAGAAAAKQRPYGDARILAQVPAPGFPEGIVVWGNTVYVAGPATFGTAGQGPSSVVGFNISTGKLVASWPTEGENLALEHANSGLAVDRTGKLFVLNIQLGIYTISANGEQEQYSTPFPDLAPCGTVPAGTPCSPTPFDAPPLPNDIVFDAAGNAYVTDSFQATIWKVPPGGGEPEIWFQDVRFASEFVGVNGMRISPDGTTVLVTVTADLTGRAWVYTLPLTGSPSAADLAPFHEYTNGDGPDGIAFGETGLLYVAIATPFASGVSILGPTGIEVGRLANQGNPIHPYDSPANITFDGKGSILLSNHAFVTGVEDPGQFAVLDVFVDDRGARLWRPKPT